MKRKVKPKSLIKVDSKTLTNIEPQVLKEIDKLVKNPTPINAIELLTGIFTSSKKELILSGSRIAQAAFKGDFWQQLGSEVKDLRKKGQIDDKHLNSRLGKVLFAELLEAVDAESMDEEKFKAMKSIFFCSIAKDTDELRQAKAYQLLRACRQLNSMDILVLKACYKVCLENNPSNESIHTRDDWTKIITEKIGFGLPQLVNQAEEKLVELGFLTAWTTGDRSGIKAGQTFRLTEGLGIDICEFITQFP